MRYLILSDIHGNWQAFSAVLAETPPAACDAVLVLGDLVGYGADPNRVVDEVRRVAGPAHVVRGNHDRMAVGMARPEEFNRVALAAARWTANQLSAENLDYLRRLPSGPRLVGGGVLICHGSPLDEDAYLLATLDAAEVFEGSPSRLVFFGHTHVPTAFVLHRDGIEGRILEGASGEIDLDPERRYLLNPGAVGQPRDRDPRAAYMIYDSEQQRVTWRRRDYAIAEAQESILDAGLPPFLAERLALGI